MKDNERDVNFTKWCQQLLEIGTGVHSVSSMSSKVLCVNNSGKELMNVLLEVGDTIRQWTNEGGVEETKIGEEVVAHNDLLLDSQRFPDSCELPLGIGKLVLWLLAPFDGEPLGINSGQIPSCQSLEDEPQS